MIIYESIKQYIKKMTKVLENPNAEHWNWRSIHEVVYNITFLPTTPR